MDQDLADLDLLMDLIDNDEEEKDGTPSVQEDAHSNKNSTPISQKDNIEILPPTDDVDPLEAELLEMEKKMKILKEKLKNKNNSFGHSLETGDQQPNAIKCKGQPGKALLMENSSGQIAKTSLKEAFPNAVPRITANSKSEIHSGDTDSDDDEDNKNPLEPKFSHYGREIKKRLAAVDTPERRYAMQIKQNNGKQNISKHKNEENQNFSKDPFSGINIVNPLIMVDTMKELMQNRKMIHMSTINLHTQGGEISGDWVTIGVIVSKSDTKTSQKGSQYCIWQMCDLKDCSKVVSVFLFAAAYKGLWKTSVGSVVGILNPQIMKDRKDNQTNLLTLSINNQQKALLLGHSKDLGFCKGRTKQGSNCHQFVNKNVCEYCMYHVQHEYKKSCSKRAEIQSSFSRVDPRRAFQNKVLGKSQVFYGGHTYSAPSTSSSTPKRMSKDKNNSLANSSSLQMRLKSNQLQEKDKKESFVLKHLSDKSISTIQEVSEQSEAFGNMLLAPTIGARNFLKHKTSNPLEDNSAASECRVESVSARDFLKMSREHISNISMKDRLDHQKKSTIPQLGRGLSSKSNIEFAITTTVVRPTDINRARAAAIIKSTGPIEPTNPNMSRSKVKSRKENFKQNVNKRLSSALEDGSAKPAKVLKIDKSNLAPKPKSLLGSIDMNSDNLKKLMNAKSSHSNLIQTVEDEEIEKYFNGQEKKEMLENKMMSIMEIPTSAVSCLKCNYTAIAASDVCKSESHPLKQVKAVKRFFECNNCKRRTNSLQKLPARPCSNCQESSWKRVGMAKGKTGPRLESEVLSLRGDELGHYSGSGSQVYLHI